MVPPGMPPVMGEVRVGASHLARDLEPLLTFQALRLEMVFHRGVEHIHDPEPGAAQLFGKHRVLAVPELTTRP